MLSPAALLLTVLLSPVPAERPQVLLIGDSISLGYTPHVVRLLQDTANVRHHKGNAQHTGTGLQKLDAWLGDTPWDVIHFNWGLWDLCYRHPESRVQGRRDKIRGTLTTTPQQYQQNLEQLVLRLKQTGARLIWASTTVVPENEAGRRLNDDLRYNDIAASVMRRHGVEINDLNAASRQLDASMFKQPGDVHLTTAGYQQLAKRVAHAIRRQLEPEASETISRIHFGSCIKQDRPMPILSTVVAEKPQMFVFLGDNIYGDTEDMSVLTTKYNTLGAHPVFQQLQQQTQLLATWDDHDYGVNDGGADYPQRKASQEVFLRFWRSADRATPTESAAASAAPASAAPASTAATPTATDETTAPHAGVYASTIQGPPGRSVQIILLDTRYFRSPLKRGERRTGGPWVPDPDPSKTMLGDTQWAWLETQLQQPAELRIIASSIQFLAADAGQETWSNLPQEKQRMLRLLEKTGVRNAVFLSGDRHWSEFSCLDRPGGRLYDFTSSSLNQRHGRGTPTENPFRLLPETFHAENYGVLLFDWSKTPVRVTCHIKDINGRVVLQHSFANRQ